MDYFVMALDPRASGFEEMDFKDIRFQKEDPFVMHLKMAPEDRLPDLIQGKNLWKTFFCVSQKMKEILDIYDCLAQSAPVFLTDYQYRSQQVYWNIKVQEQDCLVQDFYADQERLRFLREPKEGIHMFLATRVKTQYLLVSLELAENLLRRQMYGLCFFPVMEMSERRKKW